MKRRKRKVKKKVFLIVVLFLIITFVYISYKGNFKQIPEEKLNKEEVISKDKNTNNIPVILIKEDYNIEDVINIIKENNYYTISYDNYKKWQNSTKYLLKNAVLIITESDDHTKICKSKNINCVDYSSIDIDFVENDKNSEIGKNYLYTIFKSTTKERIIEILNNIPSKENYASEIAVLNYHFFTTDETESKCGEIICLEDSKFEEQLKYLKDNEYKTLTMLEYYKWLENEIQLPKKSVLLTTDDGALGTDTVYPEILTKYKSHGTLFLITGFWDIKKYPVGYMEIQDHSYSLHHRDYCNESGKCGIKTIVLTKEEIRKDLEKSRGIIKDPIAYCYPFYEYDDKTYEVVKELYKLAFVGGNKKSTRENDHYLLPRYVILSDITLNDFIEMID